LSVPLIESHYENDYGGALRRLNAITEKLGSLDFATTPDYVIEGLKRQELIALNSTMLMSSTSQAWGVMAASRPDRADAIARDFGSVDRWQDEFIAMGTALGGGSGWVLLVYIPRDRRLVNQYASEDGEAVAGGIPIVALDMYEHAYHMDFGANVKAYVGMFMRNLDWKAVQLRYEDAAKVEPPRRLVQPEFGDLPGIGVEEVKAMMNTGKPVQLVDARPWPAVCRSPEIMQGATWRDPERVQEWAGELSKTEPVVVFCSYGFHVGCKTAVALRDLGFDAKFMTGGHSAWKAIDGPTTRHAGS
jgi:Fe-Mn family superoxide dismutase